MIPVAASGWTLPNADVAHRAWRQVEQALAKQDTGGVSVWNISNPEHTEHHVVGVDTTGEGVLESAARGVALLRRAERWDVPAELVDTLMRRRLATVVENAEALLAAPGEVVHQRASYRDAGPAGGMFLHSDGTMHPFPEPRGEG